MGPTLAYLSLAISLMLLAAPAHAQVPEDKTVVVIIDAGNTDLLVESLVLSTAEAELTKRGFSIVENAKVGGDTPQRLLACAGNPTCSVATLAGIEARFVIFISLRPDEEGTSNNFKIVARNYDVATGRAIARTMRRCAECKEDVDLAAFSEGVIVDLIRDPEPIVIASVDPKEDPNSASETETVSEQDQAENVPPLVHNDGPSLMTGLKYASLVGGVAGLATGTVLVLIDGPVIRDGRRLPDERATLAGGYVSLGAGAVLLGLSGWLWSQDYDADRSTRTSLLPNVRTGAGGGSVVWTGTF